MIDKKYIIYLIQINLLTKIDILKVNVNEFYYNLKSILFNDFLNKIISQNQDKSKIYIVLDNAGYNKSAKVKEFVEKTKIELVFLPPYSPNLNAIERLWKFMYKKVVNNRFYKCFKDFSDHIDDFFAHIHKHKNQLKLLINDRFEAIKINHLSTYVCNNPT